MENILRPQFGNLVLDKRKQNQGRPTKLSDRQKRNILRQAKELQEEVGNFSAKGVMVRAGIPPSISATTVCRVMRKAGLKWSHAQEKRVLTKSDLNEIEVCQKGLLETAKRLLDWRYRILFGWSKFYTQNESF